MLFLFLENKNNEKFSCFWENLCIYALLCVFFVWVFVFLLKLLSDAHPKCEFGPLSNVKANWYFQERCPKTTTFSCALAQWLSLESPFVWCRLTLTRSDFYYSHPNFTLAKEWKKQKRGWAVVSPPFFLFVLYSILFIFGLFFGFEMRAFSWLRLEREKHCFGRCERWKEVKKKREKKLRRCVFMTSLTTSLYTNLNQPHWPHPTPDY